MWWCGFCRTFPPEGVVFLFALFAEHRTTNTLIPPIPFLLSLPHLDLAF
jgi:hypothetical protein